MKKKNKTFVHTHHGQEKTLDIWLSSFARTNLHLDWSRTYCKKAIETRQLTVKSMGQRLTKASDKIKPGSKILLYIPVLMLKKSKVEIKNKVDLDPSHLVWEDPYLLIASKPKGIPSLQTLDPSRDYFLQSVKRLLMHRGDKKPYLALHHRLDVETSGLMLFCKKKSLNKSVGELFAKRQIEKTYHAVCSIKDQLSVSDHWEFKNYLAKAPGRTLKMHAVKSGGSFAHTTFSLLKEMTGHCLIECKPHTGRTHQIRVHLAQNHLPIVNDKLYGQGEDDSLLKLHAVSLKFKHPVTEEEIFVEDTCYNPEGN